MTRCARTQTNKTLMRIKLYAEQVIPYKQEYIAHSWQQHLAICGLHARLIAVEFEKRVCNLPFSSQRKQLLFLYSHVNNKHPTCDTGRGPGFMLYTTHHIHSLILK